MERIACKECTSPDCHGCNMHRLEQMLMSGKLDALMDEKRTIKMDADVRPRWISVKERLPEPYTWVLVSAEKHNVAFDAFYDGAQWKDAVLNVLIVAHWMPLPEPPKEEVSQK